MIDTSYSVPEIARLSGFTPPTIRKAIASGDLKAWRRVKGAPFRVYESDYLDWMDSCQVEPVALELAPAPFVARPQAPKPDVDNLLATVTARRAA